MSEQQKILPRDIKQVWQVQSQRISSIHSNGFVLEPGHWREFDPFLMLAEDWFQKGSFDVHPHRGIETVTYVIEGKLEHFDNKGGKDHLLPGDVQWMTAGRGVVHLEDPAEGETVHSLQLWINLPSEQKLCEPRYQNLRSQDMPVRREEGAVIRIFSGSSAGVGSNTKNVVPVTMVELLLEPGATVVQDLPGSYQGFIYVLEGQGTFGYKNTAGGKGEVLWLGSADGNENSEVKIVAREKLRALLYAGEPLREPVVARGPFVMNTEEQIIQAYQDFREGKFN